LKEKKKKKKKKKGYSVARKITEARKAYRISYMSDTR